MIMNLRQSENFESVTDTFEVIKKNLENCNTIVQNWKSIRDRMKSLYEKRSEAFDKAITQHGDEILILQVELRATKSAFDDSDKEYQAALSYKISLERTLNQIEQIVKNGLDNQVKDPEEIN